MTIDTQLFYALNSFAGKSFYFDYMIFFIAGYLPYFVVAAFAIFLSFSVYPRQKKWLILATAAFATIAARLGATELIRFFYHRPRPFVSLQAHALFVENSWSFPSGHAIFFFALAASVYGFNKKWGSALYLAAVLIGIARVVAGVHYPSDIIGGALIGMLIGSASVYVAKHWATLPTNQTY